MLKEERNKHFDGELLDLFLNKIDEILKVKNRIDLKFKQPMNEDVFAMIFDQERDY